MALAVPSLGLADPWKDESGHGRGHHRAERWDGHRDRGGWNRHQWDRRDHRYEGERRGGYRHYAQPRIPSGHLPPGEYRAWFPDPPPGHQPPPQRW
ncbi:hypothetical protein [Belnapia sp. F-4-1]|uniref:hypothetical protein n=1 Tax=Belnapia sp. F-4-1 TaxID=1545443 RepID=UPI0011859E22|nr:hypothetical protein [Belnapia sp. F-4-1]